MYDYIELASWSLTYLLIIIQGIVFAKRGEKNLYIFPKICAILNFGWEINSVIIFDYASHDGSIVWSLVGRYAWLILDIFIYIFCLQTMKNWKLRVCYLAGLAVATLAYYFIFRVTPGGMVVSAFIIDFIMAAMFLVKVNTINNVNAMGMIVAVMKLISDTLAWRAYTYEHIAINYICPFIFACDLAYVIYVDYKLYKKRNSKTVKK